MATLENISDHIVDICENAVRSESSNCLLIIQENSEDFYFEITDFGKGMTEEELQNALDPFYTTKTERKKKFGVGLPFLKFSAELTGGYLKILSKKHEGTTVKALFKKNNIDCQPIGNVSQAIFTIIFMRENVNWKINRFIEEEGYDVDTLSLKEEYEDIFFKPSFMNQLRLLLEELEVNLKGGNT